VAVERSQLATDDPGHAEEVLNGLFGRGRPLQFSGDQNGFRCELRFATAGVLGCDRVRHTMDARVVMDPVEFFLAGVLRGGLYERFDAGEDSLRVPRGDVVLYPAEKRLEAEWSDVEVVTIRLERKVINRVARERMHARDSVSFEGLRPVSEAAARGWRQLTRFVQQEITAEGSMLDSPLIEAQMAELIAATALQTFSNSAMGALPAGPRSHAMPGTIRRAVEFIEANAAEPISISDMAAAANVTPRALQYGFARHLDCTPMGYLRRVRLEHAHRDLQAADPAAGQAVAEIARRWGFGNPGRFAAAYRDVYDVSPSHTLRA
jgi:AraC-like DNA-binding protein